MQRFLGTHQSIGESFLLKVVEKLEGREAALKFIDQISTQNGFELGLGFSITIEPDGESAKIRIVCGDNTILATPEIIEAIIKDRVDLDKTVGEQEAE